ncbi:MAG: hypothetical protein Q9M15_08180 [Mariprofundaceae bacterium]|nr:hypothetical protein [Mariprofundaceae bacterium]
MLKTYIQYLAASILLSFSCISSQASEVKHSINIIAFQANTAGFKYESIINGQLGQVISGMQKDTHVILASHTSALKDRDVINLQVDVMHMTRNGELASGGLDCRFIFNDESDADSAFFSISGICDRLTATATGTIRKQALLPRKMLSDPSDSFNVWLKLYDNPTTGVAIYTDID